MQAFESDRYELLRQIGAGGFGVVHLARDRCDGQYVAIKLLHSVDAQAESRFDRETLLLAQLQHPNIVRYAGHGRTVDGQAYLAMEWLDGQTLETRLQAGPLSVESTLTFARQVVAGLSEAYRLGIVHRDLKPANFFLVGDEIANSKILDFGLARRVEDDHSQVLTRTGVAIGTPHYMSPEQARGERFLDVASDVFSLGSVLYECLTGLRPFETGHALATLMMICLEEPARIETIRSDVPDALRRLIDSMLSKRISARPSLASLAVELDRITLLTTNREPSDTRSMQVNIVRDPALARTALTPPSQQRVLAALFMARPNRPVEEVEEELLPLLATHRARAVRLRDGSRILLFDAQVTAGEQTLAAARCARSLLTWLPEVPLVVCTGRALVDSRLPLGDLIERGARMLSTAMPGCVQVDDTSAGLLGARFHIRGDEAQRQLGSERTGGDAPRTLLGQVTPFVGRERELERLEKICLESLEDSTARAVLVLAPAGAGKSRLRYELRQRLSQIAPTLTVLTAQADATRSTTPFGLLAPLLQDWAQVLGTDAPRVKQAKVATHLSTLLSAERSALVAPFLGELMGVPFPDDATPRLRSARKDPQLMGEILLSSFLEWLKAWASTQPVALFVEDLHWADPGSVRFLDAALRNLEELPFVLLAFARPEVKDLFPKLWAERELLEMRLTKLSPKACGQLLQAISAGDLSEATQSWLVERAEGNPFFLEELVRSRRTQTQDGRALPDSIVGIIQTRLDSLGEAAALIIRAASVFGQIFRPDDLQALVGMNGLLRDVPSRLNLLVDREVIFARGELEEREYVFRHALIRDAAYALLLDEERKDLHRRAADWLEAKGGAEPALLAFHFETGGALSRAAHWYGLALPLALEANSNTEVVRCGERAVACGASGDALGEIASLVAETQGYAGADAHAIEWGTLAKDNALAGSAAWWRARQVLVVSYFRLGEGEKTAALIDQMIDCAPEAPSLPAAILALSVVTQACALHALGAAQIPRLLRALPVRVSDQLPVRVRSIVHVAKSCAALFAGDLGLGLRHTEHGIEASRGAAMERDLLQQLCNAGWLLTELGSYDRATLYLEEALDLSRRMGLKAGTASAAQNLGAVRLQRGQVGEALGPLREAVATYASLGLGIDESLATSCLALAHLHLGDEETAEELADRALVLGSAEPTARAASLTMSAKLALLQGRGPDALRAIEEAFEIVRDLPLLEHITLTRLLRILALRASGEEGRAEVALREAREWLLARAAKLDDGAMRRAFLEDVPDNAQLLALSAESLKTVG